ncbi:unnamed protein product [Prorocentrum cordatum]|uniref:DUF4215 domain-containing protein n=1 Tax=Prorocentrum cordatum TaxID=2364126 RepID=A0ABN9WWN0_9DINO|nr:unnamed protein product [Polarella glacialis]
MEDAPWHCMHRPLSFMDDMSNAAACSGQCGNAMRESSEGCDDGNDLDGDGCSHACVVEAGYFCSGGSQAAQDVCALTVCGDGLRSGAEECDDGNLDSSDGCSPTCLAEPGYVCTGNTSCAPVCGDGRRTWSEGCDDGNVADGDGCSHACAIEAGFTCEGGTPYVSDACSPICGNGQRVGAEECDDGNTADGDGCSSACAVESGFSCYGGSQSARDECVRAACGDGVVEGTEECDDFNTLGGDGCSATCSAEPRVPSSTVDFSVSVEVFPLPQACRIHNGASHQTEEDTAGGYNLQHTTLTGDVYNTTNVSISIRVHHGFLTVEPLIEAWGYIGKADAVPDALIYQEAGVVFSPFALELSETVMSGTAISVDDFLRRSLYVRPQANFAGYARVDVEMLSGVRLNYGADACKVTLPVLVTDVFDDAPAFTGSLGEAGLACTAGSEGCALEGLGVSDPDCPRAVDGSCYLRLSLNASAGGMLLLGRSMVPASNLSDLKGHGPGLNAALQRVRYVPPAVQPSGGVVEIFALLERVVLRTNATPAALQSASAVLAIQVSVPMADMAPTLRRGTGESFHGSVFVAHGPQPFVIDDIVFEHYGTGGAADKVLITLEVSRGYLFLGTTDGTWLEDGSAEGTSRLKFRANSIDLASLYPRPTSGTAGTRASAPASSSSTQRSTTDCTNRGPCERLYSWKGAGATI